MAKDVISLDFWMSLLTLLLFQSVKSLSFALRKTKNNPIRIYSHVL
jgi:hypothetical protein